MSEEMILAVGDKTHTIELATLYLKNDVFRPRWHCRKPLLTGYNTDTQGG